MTRPSIDEQIEAVESILRGMWMADAERPALEAAIATLSWVKRYAPTIKALKEQFPESRFMDRREDDENV